ncbi:MAG: cupredoxin family copper-binding protein [Gammaproteobacteria bacterium]
MIFAKRRSVLATLVVSALCLALTGTPATAAQADGAEVVIKDFMFSPVAVKVKAGSRVTWTNKDDEPHNVVSDTGLFRSSAMDTDENFSFKFDKPGTYHFVCSIHPRMVGTITVE